MDFASLHELLHSTYEEMMPLCAQMTGIAKGIAGLGALFYIALRVWASIARAEAIDVFPLLRPFVLGFCIMFFPTVVLGTMNAVLSPVVQGTESMVHQQETNLAELTAKRNRLQEEAYLRNPETAYLVSNEKFDQKIEEMGIIGPEDAVTIAGMYAERAAYQTKQWVMKMVHDLMELLFHAAGLIIDTLRTFILIVLSILGECALALESEQMAVEKEEAAVLAKNEQLRANLLRAISHDLRTPLTSISGNASNLLANEESFDKATRHQIYRDIYNDSLWLINLVENLLSVTRITKGEIQLHLTAELMDEVVAEALRHVGRQSAEHTIRVISSDDLILAKICRTPPP